MTTTIEVQKDVVDALRSAGTVSHVMVGGAAVTDVWAKEIGATYAPDAGSAVAVARNLLVRGG